MINQGALNRGQGNSLLKKLLHAIKQLNKGHKTTAINILGSFIIQINDFISEGILSLAEGEVLIDAVNQVISTIKN